MRLSDFSYQVDQDLIALHPLSDRDQSKMLVVDAANDIIDSHINKLLEYITPNDLIVLNNTKVLPSRIQIYKASAPILIYLDQKVDETHWRVYAKPGRKLRAGDVISIGDDFALEVIEKVLGEKRMLVKFHYKSSFFELLEKYGSAPLPPYIEKRRKSSGEDTKAYQSVFAKHPGSVAAPTASLHFSDELLDKIRANGVQIAYVTLHVGSGTFSPVEVEDITEHKMHEEYCELSSETANLVNEAKARGGRVLAVGTTALRTLESCATDINIVQEFSGTTDIFIKPGYKFKIVDMLLTNFHLPKSTLFILVSAFVGCHKIKEAYRHAIENKYRFFSYGDCCLLHREDALCL